VCGIAGLLDPTGGAIDGGTLGAMTAALAPRGPDAEGVWTAPGVGLGHRRLKVIDLSEAAAQPMANEDGSVRVVFNGEIYNFADLRVELLALGHTFRSRSDTEVLVHGYEAWGDAVVDRIDGMFAFALWDARHRRLLAARDRMGKKPLYYAQVVRGGGAPPLFAFASELKGLLPVPGLDTGIDSEALARYLVFEYVPPPRSILRGARKLDAGERLVLEAGRAPFAMPQVRRTWDLPFPAHHDPVQDEASAAADLLTLLRRAVERRLVSDVPLGAFLSGGIDSSAVVSLMTEIVGADRVKTFSIGFSDRSFDETDHARDVARRLRTDHFEERVDASALIDALPDVASFLDEPLGDASIVPTYLLARFTRRHVTVVLSGDGGDELFAGYPTFTADRAGKLFFDALPRAAQGLAHRAAARLPARTGYFSFDFATHQFLRGGDTPGPRRHQRWLASFLPEEVEEVLAPEVRRLAGGDPLADVDARAAAGPARDERDRLMDFYARFYLPGDVNVKVDRAAGAVGLEVRAPFLDTDLVTFACRLPPELRMRRMTSKYLLKRALRGRLPDHILDRRKQGFGVPVARWMRHELAPAVRDELAPAKLAREGLLDPAAVSRVVDDHLSGRRDRRKQLWTLFVFERWLARWRRG
jgi:asparagine synthase (glutamine-hydrolysing)